VPLTDLLPWRVAERKRNAAPPTTPAPIPAGFAGKLPARSGFVLGVPPQGTDANDYTQGAATETDRATLLQELWEEYLRCPWSWACVNAIARTVTAGGLVQKWDSDTGEGDQKQPDKPAQVLAFERLLAFCNPEQDIRQLMRNVVADLQVFADAFIEVVWLGNLPVALYNQDCPTTFPVTNEHGDVSRYKQVTEYGQEAEFEPRQIIHISLGSARPSMLGVSPTHAAEESIVAWMYLHSCEKEAARRGLPPNVHADHPAGTPEPEVRKWQDQYQVSNIGPQNVGTPITTRGGGKVTELQSAKLTDILAAKKEARNEIISSYGVPPAKVGVIESGNLGGGTGSDQNKTYFIDLINPIAQLIAEKLQFALGVKAFGVTGWHVAFNGVDYRDDQTIENIRDMRLRNGAWTRNRYAADIGEPPVEGGNDPVLVARQDIVLWRDMADRSRAGVEALTRDPATGPDGPAPNGPRKPGPAPTAGPGSAAGNETIRAIVAAVVAELRTGDSVLEHTPALTTAQRVRNQLSRNFPASSAGWVDDATWQDGIVHVPVDQIGTEHAASWAAAHDGPDVKRLQRKLRKTGKLKPLILVSTPGSAKYVIADGHHHALAAIKAGASTVRAYVGHVDSDTGDWDVMVTHQHRKAA
jgi:phage portal protein BeeE